MTRTPAWAREGLALATLLALGGLLLARHIGLPSLEFDEQVYLASADLLGRGFELGRDVVSSQPPLFLGGLHEAAALANGDATVLRALFVALTLVGALGGWAIVRRLAGPLPALLTAALIVVAPGVVEAAAVVSADVPSVALGTLALLAARRARTDRRAIGDGSRRSRHVTAAAPVWWGALAGALLACALLTKLLAAPFAIAIAVAALVERPPRRALAGFAAGTGAVLAITGVIWAGALGALWDGAVVMHLDARRTVSLPPVSIALEITLTALAYAGLFAILAAGVLGVRRVALRGWLAQRADLIALMLAGVAMCAVQKPLMNHHLVAIAWPLALLAGSAVPARPLSGRRASLALLVVGAVLVVPWTVHGRSTMPTAERVELRAVAGWVAARTAPGDEVVSDLPVVALLAGRTPAPETVDPSYVRLATGQLSRGAVLRAVDRAGAVVVGRSFRRVAGLRRLLDERYGARRSFGDVDVWAVPRLTGP